MSPSSFAVSSVTSPDSTSTSASRPSCEAAASLAPSGDATSRVTLPRPTDVRVRTVAADSASISATWMASRPLVLLAPASVTQATLPVVPRMTGSRARAAGFTERARAGPSACVSQCTVPRTSTTLAWPVLSQSISPW